MAITQHSIARFCRAMTRALAPRHLGVQKKSRLRRASGAVSAPHEGQGADWALRISWKSDAWTELHESQLVCTASSRFAGVATSS